ncbi:calcium-binding protein [Mycobacterium sp. KBS0706]|uniref:calcium-binding protein n=1 Tax=Mycobacterium sp. KBS0706 TaxID=2578109 RepID=UPI00163D6CE1|nr:hypothetical protein [Mycobacterium sp. KBS0706]
MIGYTVPWGRHPSGGCRADTIEGGDGIDTADYSTSGAAVFVDLATDAANLGDAAYDTLTGIENLRGSAFDDLLNGNAAANRIEGLDGSDQVNAGDGAGIVDGGAGQDTLRGDAGDDRLAGGAGSDILRVGVGADHLTAGANYDTGSYWASAVGVNIDLKTMSTPAMMPRAAPSTTTSNSSTAATMTTP